METFEQVFAQRNNKARQVIIAGYPCLVKRVPLQAYIAHGIIPQEMALELAQAVEAEQAATQEGEQADDSFTEETKALLLKFRQTVIELGVVHPRLSFAFEPPPGKVSVWDLSDPEQFIDEAYLAVMGQPVATAEGEVSATALQSFRDDGNGAQESASTGAHGAELRDTSSALAGSD